MDACTPFEGNPDFYGLGIRIGVYLQWVSAWISLLLDPESAQATYDTNSVFVFALIIATIIAARRDAPAIEIYIMLQIIFGFFATTLSTIGIRLWLMSPDRLAKLEGMMMSKFEPIWHGLRQSQPYGRSQTRAWVGRAWELWAQIAEYSVHPEKWPSFFSFYLRLLEGLNHLLLPQLEIPLNVWSPLKPPGLSWSGVFWRTATVTIIATYNLAFWFDTSGGAQEPPRPGCGSPYIFLFSKQRLEGPVLIFCYVTAVLLAIIVFPVALVLLLLALKLLLYACLFVYRDLVFGRNPSTRQTFQSALSRVNTFLEKSGIPPPKVAQPLMLFNPMAIVTPVFGSFLDILGFLATPKGNTIRFSDFIKVCVSLGTGKVMAGDARRVQGIHDEGLMSGWKNARSRHQTMCSLWNVYIILSTAWFITSIECTIYWNNISGVNTIDTTGQLIPFIIGCVSASQVMKKLTLLALSKEYPDWVDVKLEVEGGVNGPMVFKIVKRDGSDNPEEGNIDVYSTGNYSIKGRGDDDIGDSQTWKGATLRHRRRQSI